MTLRLEISNAVLLICLMQHISTGSDCGDCTEYGLRNKMDKGQCLNGEDVCGSLGIRVGLEPRK